MKTEIFDYGMNGEGVGKVDGKIVLLPNSLIGETVDFEIVNEEKNFSTGAVKNVEKRSKKRFVPKCPYFGTCGGCDIQHMCYDEQLNFKKLLVEKTIKKITGIEIKAEPTIASNKQFNYRNKISFNVQNNKIGFYKFNTKDIVDIKCCELADEKINKILTIFNKNMKNSLEFIKNLVVRIINNQILVGVVASKFMDLTALYNALESEFDSVGVYHILNTRKDSVVLSGKATHVAGIKEINISNFGLNYSVDLMGFHQTNEYIQNEIYTNVLNLVEKDSIILNGFSGQGLLTAVLAKKAKHVYGIEINKSSHLSAENLKRINKIDNMTNICGDFYKNFDKMKEKINTIVLDPAKKGCGKDTMCAIIGVENIIYISCNPIALSKDLRELSSCYEIEKVIPFDMFPNTKNVETLVKLKLKEN